MSFSVIKNYILGMGYSTLFITGLLFIIGQVFFVSSSIWLSTWSNAAETQNRLQTSERDLYIQVYAGLASLYGKQDE